MACWADQPVTVQAPATSANLGPGFDSLGLALSLYDTVRASILPSGLEVTVTGAGADAAGRGDEHLVIRAMRAAFAVIGAHPPGIAMNCRNEVPQGFGLGSSAAAIVCRTARRQGAGRCGRGRGAARGRAAAPGHRARGPPGQRGRLPERAG